MAVTGLNETGKRRLSEKGLTCFVHPDRDGLMEAVCVDFGLSALADTAEAAMAELMNVTSAAWQLAIADGMAEQFLNQPNNRAAERQLVQARMAFAIARTMLFPFQMFGEVRNFLTRTLVKTYDQRLDTSDFPPHAFAI